MKKDCERTRKAFPRYLRGHVFRMERGRIERHLSACVLCRSEYEGLKRAAETRQILKDIAATEGIAGRVRDAGSRLSGLKKIFYRPLWIAAIILASAAIYHYAVTPRQIDLEIEQIVKSEPAGTPSALQGEAAPAATAPTPSASLPPAPPAAAAPAATPLAVSVATHDEAAAIRRINEALRGNGRISPPKLSKTAREVSGTMTARELKAFFSRIEPAGRLSYNRKRFESFSGSQSIPFTLMLQAAPRTAANPPLSAQPAQAPGAQVPAGAVLPHSTATGPTRSTLQ